MINISSKLFYAKKVVITSLCLLGLRFVLAGGLGSITDLIIGFALVIFILVLLFAKKLSFSEDQLKIGQRIIPMQVISNISIFNMQLFSFFIFYIPSNSWISRRQVCLIQRFWFTKSHFENIAQFKENLLEHSSIPKKRINEIISKP